MSAIFSETGPFDVVVIDPPWPMQKIDRDERPNQAEFDYPIMTIDELAKLPKAKGTRGQGRPKLGVPKGDAPKKDDTPSIIDIGLTPRRLV